MTQGSPTEEQQ
jgi:hypothetical protein